jgi:hypothetical protein
MNTEIFILLQGSSMRKLLNKPEVKHLGPHKPDDFILVKNKSKLDKPEGQLEFQRKWLYRKLSLACSMSFKGSHSFLCFLFGGED